MKAYEKDVKFGLMNAKKVDKILKEIEEVPWNNIPCNSAKHAMVVMIEEQRYFPILSTLKSNITNIISVNN